MKSPSRLSLGLVASVCVGSVAWAQATPNAGLEAGSAALQRRDYLEAFVKLRPLADNGVPEAQELLANLYERGLGVPQNPAEAVHLRTEAVRGREARAASEVLAGSTSGPLRSGLSAFDSGDYLESFTKLKPLSDAGEPRAQVRLGDMYLHGLGIPQNKPEAARLYQLASRGSGGDALQRLARERLGSVEKEPDAGPLATTTQAPSANGSGSMTEPPKAKKPIPWKTIGMVALGVIIIAGVAYAATQGGGYAPSSSDYGAAATDTTYAWDQFRDGYGGLEWRCRGRQTGRFADNWHCAAQLKSDFTWPGY